MAREIRKVVVLGANGAMGAGSGMVFAAAGIPTVFLARTRDKAEKGLERAVKMAKAEAIAEDIRVGSYDEDLEGECADADIVFEAVAEDLALKKTYFEKIDRVRKPDSIVATVSSGLSIAAMVEGLSEGFRKNFLGMHLFNPPNVIVGCEVIPHADTDPAITDFTMSFLAERLGRKVVKTADTPAFAGNRIGFKVMNETAQLAAEHGVAFMDALIGPHTGRAMPPLTTADFVGWDVHRAIVDNVYANTDDEAHEAFALPGYMAKLVDAGHLGRKTPDKGGFFKVEKRGDDKVELVLDPASGEYRPVAEVAGAVPELATRMSRLHRIGRYRDAMALMAEARGDEADLMRRVVLGYVSYGLCRVGEVVETVADVDRIMGFGFNWAPPGLLVDVIGAKRTVELLEAAGLPVPKPVVEAAEKNQNLFRERHTDIGRFFFA